MADIAVETNETPVVEKPVAEEEVAKDVEEGSTTENGAEAASNAKENGDVAPEAEAAAEGTDTAADAEESTEAAVEENGDEEDSSKEANGDSTDSALAEAVKRKVVEGGDVKAADDSSAATPEKKAKLDEATKDEVQNGSEASEVAA